MKTTVIVGASNNPNRYAYLAAERLQSHGHPFIPLSIKPGNVLGETIQDIRQAPELGAVDTLTMYINPKRQAPYLDYFISLQPKRIVFNPGAENPELAKRAIAAGIEIENACTLVMLGSGVY